MDLQLRDITDDEIPDFTQAVWAAFGAHRSEQDIADWAALTAGSDRFAVFDAGEIVGTAGAYAFEVTVPGGGTVPASGLTAVGVRPTHRRRGILDRMMGHHLETVAGRDLPLSILTASESVIYGRYGYGAAADLAWWRLPTAGATLASPSRAVGRLRVVDRARAREVAPVVYEAHRAATAGALTRSSAYWDNLFLDREDDREGASALFHVVHEAPDGAPDGYASYRRKGLWSEAGLPAGELIATSVLAADPEVEAALWELLLGVDLVATVRGQARPVDEPLRWRLADPRRLQIDHVGDHLWVRILDVAACLEARSYATTGTVVLDVADERWPDAAGRWRLDAGPGGATCARTTDPADVALGIADLGALYLGGVRPATLARAGRLAACTPGAVERLDVLVSTPTAPWCASEF